MIYDWARASRPGVSYDKNCSIIDNPFWSGEGVLYRGVGFTVRIMHDRGDLCCIGVNLRIPVWRINYRPVINLPRYRVDLIRKAMPLEKSVRDWFCVSSNTDVPFVHTF